MTRLLLALLGVACVHARTAQWSAVALPDTAEGGEAQEPEQPEPRVRARAYRHYLDALLARNAEDPATAVAELQSALLYDPRSPHLHSVLAEVLLKQGRIGEAEEHLRAALDLDPRHAPARLLSARLAASRGQVLLAREHFQAAIEAQPDDPEAYRELARLLLSTGDAKGAEDLARRLGDRLRLAQQRSLGGSDEVVIAERLRDYTASTWVELGRWFAPHGMDEAAQRAFAQARSASPSDPEALAAEAAWLESKRRYAEARERYLKLLAQRPEAPEILAALARAALSDGDLDAVTGHARKLLALAASAAPWDGKSSEGEEDRRDLAGALLRVAVPLMGAHRSAEAQVVLEAALRLYPGHPELSFYRALALVQRGRPREGAAAFEWVERRLVARRGEPAVPAFLGMDPGALVVDARIQAALARGRAGEAREAMRRLRSLFAQRPGEEGVALALLEVFDRAGKVAEAEQLFAAAADAHPPTDGLLYALANAQDRAGARRKALSTMRKVLAVQPEHTGALNYIGYTLTELGDPQELHEAELLLARAVELRPDDGAIADSYGFCLLKLGRARDALPELRRADRLAPQDPVILGHLGDALLAAGRRDEALVAFRRALSALLSLSARPAGAAETTIDPPDRADRDDAKVRAEIERKLNSLAP
ncbi:MAG: tetratricopeptide repeat protein [Myxococcales bacterium]